MSKKILKDLFLMSEESSYKNNMNLNSFQNDDFSIKRYNPFYIFLKTRKENYTVSRIIPKFWLFLTITSFIFLLAIFKLDDFEPMRFFLLLVLPYIITYSIMYIMNYKLIKKYKNIKKHIKNSKKDKKKLKIKNIADDIINNNIRLMRKMKLQNMKNNE